MAKIQELIIIAAPSCAGKSYLVEMIGKGAYPTICKQLGIADFSSWRYMYYQNAKDMLQPINERLIIHYDLTGNYFGDEDFSNLQELVNRSERVVTVTIHVTQETLIRRNTIRLRNMILHPKQNKDAMQWAKWISSVKRLWRVRKFYKRGFSEHLYERWATYLLHSNIDSHWQLDFNQSRHADALSLPACLSLEINTRRARRA